MHHILMTDKTLVFPLKALYTLVWHRNTIIAVSRISVREESSAAFFCGGPTFFLGGGHTFLIYTVKRNPVKFMVNK